MFNDNDRGQVGIGTLIVFIAMVLVAAIAAGVLINTAGLLQSQAEATGEESAQQVSDRVQVSTVTGVVGGPDADDNLVQGEVDRIQLSVFRGAGADDINLEDATVDVFANGESDILTFDESSTDTDDSEYTLEDDHEVEDNDELVDDGFAIVSIQGAENGVLADSSDRAELIFDLTQLGENAEDATLEPGQSVTISITTAAGGTSFVEKRAPSSLDEDGETIRL